MGKVSREQALEVGAKIQTNINWDELDSELLQEVLRDPIALGRKFTLFLANRAEMQIILTTDGIQVPEGGRIHIVAVPVEESRSWREAVKAAGPNTDKSWDIWKMGGQYPPSETGSGLKKVILVNFGKYTRSEDNLAWARAQKLKPISPRAALAVGEHCPTLNRNLGLEYMAVVSLVPCYFEGKQNVVYSWWASSRRRARHYWLGYEFRDHSWFGFSRESE